MPSRRHVIASLGLLATGGCLGTGDGDDAPAATDGHTDWPLPDFDASGTSYNPDATGPRSTPEKRWRRAVPQPAGRPVVAGGRVFLPTFGGLRSFARDGSPGWLLTPLADRSTVRVTGPAVHDGTAYVGTDDRRSLLALDAASGDEIWRIDVGDVSVSPTPDHDWETVFVGTRDGTVARVDAESGEVRWTASVFGAVTSLATSADIAYVGTEAGEVYALFDDGGHGPADGRSEAGANRTRSGDSEVRNTSGSRTQSGDSRGLWRRKLPGSVVDVALGNGGPVYATTFAGGTFELADGLHAGRTSWHVESGPAKDSLVLTDDAVYGADGGGLVSMRRHGGGRRWAVDGSFVGGMAGAGDTLYVGGEDGVSAYRMGGGLGVGDLRLNARRWRVGVEGSVVHGLAVADGTVFAPVSGTEDTPAALLALDAS